MFRHTSRLLLSLGAIGLLSAALSTPAAAQGPWYTGMRAFGKVTVEPAIDDMTGQQVFLLTPDKAPFPSKAPEKAQSPLYLVAYPTSSTITDAFNCTPTTCDHAQSLPLPWYPSNGLLKGHDHLVGIPQTGGDWNVAWDVEVDAFTQKGFQDGAINTRIMTLAQLNAAKANGDVFPIDIHTVFNCSSTNISTYLRGTPLSFTPH